MSSKVEPTSQLRKVLPEQGWTASYWSVSQLEALTFKALGLHTYLMSLPDGWQISADRIARTRKDGRDSIRSAMAELKACGLLTSEKVHGKDGKFITVTSVRAVPVDNEDTRNGKSVPGVTSGNTVKTQVAPGPGLPAPVNPVSKKRDSLEEMIKEEIPPPTSSTTVTTRPVAEVRTEEEDFPSDIKNFVANLDYHGQDVGRPEYTRVAKALKRLWGHVHPADLKRRLQHNASIGAQSLVAVYVHRLNELTIDDLTHKSSPNRRNSSGRAKWCAQAGICDPNTRKMINGDGFVTKVPCGACG